VRTGTCYGLSAAVGKAGAVIGTQAFKSVCSFALALVTEASAAPSAIASAYATSLSCTWRHAHRSRPLRGDPRSACCGVAGILVTYFFIPNLTSEDLAREDADWQAYLAANGWQGEVGEGRDAHLVGNAAKISGTGSDVDEKLP
jgi:hypothetical protein